MALRMLNPTYASLSSGVTITSSGGGTTILIDAAPSQVGSSSHDFYPGLAAGSAAGYDSFFSLYSDGTTYTDGQSAQATLAMEDGAGSTAYGDGTGYNSYTVGNRAWWILVVSDTGDVTLYFNDTQWHNESISHADWALDHLFQGYGGQGDDGNYLGELFEVIVYDGAMTSTEVSDFVNNGTEPSYTELYRTALDAGSGTTIDDDSGNSNSGTIQGTEGTDFEWFSTAVTVSESGTVTATATPNGVETASAAELGAASAAATPAAIETGVANESGAASATGQLASTETTLANEVAAFTANVTPSVNEAIPPVYESASLSATVSFNVTETKQIGGNPTIQPTVSISAIETATANEDNRLQFEAQFYVDAYGHKSESGAASAATSVSATEEGVATETPTPSGTVSISGPAETTQSSESSQATATGNPNATETALATDGGAVVASASPAATDVATAAERGSISVSSSVSCTETATASEQPSLTVTPTIVISSIGHKSEQAAFAVTTTPDATETTLAEESGSINPTTTINSVDDGNAVEQPTISADVNLAVDETVTLPTKTTVVLIGSYNDHVIEGAYGKHVIEGTYGRHVIRGEME